MTHYESTDAKFGFIVDHQFGDLMDYGLQLEGE